MGFALALFALVLGLVLTWYRQVNVSASRLDTRMERLQSLALLRDALEWDLTRSSPPELSGGSWSKGGEQRRELELWIGEAGKRVQVKYRLQPHGGRLERNGVALALAGVTDLRFTVLLPAQPLLQVYLDGPGCGGPRVLDLPLPAALEGLRGWCVPKA